MRLERHMDPDMRRDVVALDRRGAAGIPLAGQVQVVGALATNMLLADVLLERRRSASSFVLFPTWGEGGMPSWSKNQGQLTYRASAFWKRSLQANQRQTRDSSAWPALSGGVVVGAVEGAGVASLDAELLEPVEDGFAAAVASPCWADMVAFAVLSLSPKGGGPCIKQRGVEVGGFT
jgi:hypothetical protein